MKILIGINILSAVRANAYISHMAFACAIGKKHPDWNYILYTPERASIDNMRNQAAKMALDQECDYLMFIDDDVVIEPNTLDVLLSRGKDIIAAETYVRGYPFNAMFFIERNGSFGHYNDYSQDVNADGLLRVDAVGFSCVLIKCSLLKQLTVPYFITGPNFTEDVYFCLKAQQELGRDKISIYVDTTVPTGHMLNPDLVHKTNVELLRKFHKEQLEVVTGSPDRGDDYKTSVENLFEDSL